MVNVNAQFPFNLHNQHLDDPSPSRSSRNVSGGTYGSSRPVSPSPHPSLKKSQSSTSVHDSSPHRLPAILNVKLVKVGRPLGEYGPTNDRGLPHSDIIQSADEKHEPAGDGEPTSSTQYPQPSLSAQEPGSQQVSHLNSSWSLLMRRQMLPAAPVLDQTVTVITPCSPDSFTIHDAGAVSRSWRD